MTNDKFRILFLDIETAPNRVYTWGLWKQNIALNQIDEVGYTLCWAAKWLGQKEMMFASIRKHGKRAMLKRVYDLLAQADVVVHYNGKNFDIPILNQEFMIYGWSPPAPFLQIDLLQIARKQFRLASNKLDYVLGYLGIGHKVQHKGMALWTECMAGQAQAWKTMERYNKGDVSKLEKVYRAFLPWIANHPNYGLFIDSSRPVCPNCGSKRIVKRGLYYTQTLTYQRYRCGSCGSWSKDRLTNLSVARRKNILKGI